MKIDRKRAKIYTLAFALAVLAGSLCSLGLQACTSTQQKAVDVKEKAESCAQEPQVKACIDDVFTQCFARTIVIDNAGECITKETAEGVAKCFAKCSRPLDNGEAGAQD